MPYATADEATIGIGAFQRSRSAPLTSLPACLNSRRLRGIFSQAQQQAAAAAASSGHVMGELRHALHQPDMILRHKLAAIMFWPAFVGLSVRLLAGNSKC